MFKPMAEFLSPAELGDFKIDIFNIESNNISARIQGISPGRYARLKHKGECVMSDTDMEKRTNRMFVARARGDVLIGGLGIGMIIMAIQDDKNVRSITVIEKYQEVIDLVTSQLNFNEKVKIICADAFDWKPDKGVKYDSIYMDIWPWISEDIYEKEMKPLKRKYGHYLKPIAESPKRFNECWAEYYARMGYRLM